MDTCLVVEHLAPPGSPKHDCKPASSPGSRYHLINDCYVHRSADRLHDASLALLGWLELLQCSTELFPFGPVVSALPTSRGCCVAKMRWWVQKNYINTKALHKCEEVLFLSPNTLGFSIHQFPTCSSPGPGPGPRAQPAANAQPSANSGWDQTAATGN